MMNININCDMGESFSLYKMGDDEAIMPFITQANIACGFHASDPNHMYKSVMLAKKYNIKVGAHFSVPDLLGFGRREMKIDREEMVNIMIYQIGALCGFLKFANMPLSHLKPHGALYGMAFTYEHIAHAIADVATCFDVPVFGLAGTLHEQIYTQRGLKFCPEYFVDLDYDEDGKLLITREHEAVDPIKVGDDCLKVLQEGKITSVGGKEIAMQATTFCVHSDTPNAIDIAKVVHKILQPYLEKTHNSLEKREIL